MEITSPSISDMYRTYFFTVVPTSIVAMLLHIVGIFSIYLYKKKTNQNIILTYLSLADITGSIYRILTEFALVATIEWKRQDRLNIILALNSVFYVGLYSLAIAYIILTIDRLVCCVNPLKYKL